MQLRKEEFFPAVSKGLELVYENSTKLWESAFELQNQDHLRGFKILEAFAREEAAKYLILLDAIRCPKKEQANFSRQLEKFNDHLAKGVYSHACEWRPSSYADLKRYVRSELDQYYLDGPSGYEWIFRNSIASQREEQIYVDYVEYEEGHNEWVSPEAREKHWALYGGALEPAVIKMMRALHSTKLYAPAALRVFSDYWRNYSFTEETHHQEFEKANIESLQAVESASLLTEPTSEALATILELYPYPLYKEPMKQVTISRESLKEQQENAQWGEW
jgi:AbiV family abortive infection protein